MAYSQQQILTGAAEQVAYYLLVSGWRHERIVV
jgi:hypothetical protein